ncbi:hypothetical protein JOD54_000563 [Actinokineospora baliensis]|uniref:DUF4082 domain-containing protein n=1 Tax=Actinokineospora baliensis TaxID=547056 RepID=UPI00195B3E98|nr:DUF4082 domain-containing protein [Actinokineospora baliensis]MBM7770359.1 hypothetical protein [Actinokineospora baliensis]
MLRRLVALVSAALLAPLATPTTAAAAVDEITSWTQLPRSTSVLPLGRPVLITGVADHTPWSPGYEQPISAVEVSFDGGAHWDSTAVRAGLSSTKWSVEHTFTTPGAATVTVRAWIQSRAQNTPLHQVDYWVGSGPLPTLPCSACPLPTPPRGDVVENPVDPDPRAVELGVRFQVDRPGHISSIRSTNNYAYGEGTRIARLWTASGDLLGEALENSTTVAHDFDFATWIPVQPGVTYVASVHTPWGNYASTENYFTAAIVQAPFLLEEDAGVYRYPDESPFGVPTQTYAHSAYSVVPVFSW